MYTESYRKDSPYKKEEAPGPKKEDAPHQKVPNPESPNKSGQKSGIYDQPSESAQDKTPGE